MQSTSVTDIIPNSPSRILSLSSFPLSALHNNDDIQQHGPHKINLIGLSPLDTELRPLAARLPQLLGEFECGVGHRDNPTPNSTRRHLPQTLFHWGYARTWSAVGWSPGGAAQSARRGSCSSACNRCPGPGRPACRSPCSGHRRRPAWRPFEGESSWLVDA